MEIALLLSAAEFAPEAKRMEEDARSPVGIQEVAAGDRLLRQIAAATKNTAAGASMQPRFASQAMRALPEPHLASSSPTPYASSSPSARAAIFRQAHYPPTTRFTLPVRSTLASPPTRTPTRPSPPTPHPSTLLGALPTIGKDGKLKRFLCPFPACAVRFGQKGSLTRHIRSRHEHRRPHACGHCTKSFSEKWTLDVHVRNVHLKQQPHACATCGKCFGERWNLQKHINVVHKRIKPFRCGICDRAFGYKGDMRKHVNELHRTPGRPFRCEEPGCGVNFARLRYLRRHQNTAHQGEGLGEALMVARRSSAEVAAMASTPTSAGSGASSSAVSAASAASARAATSNAVYRPPTGAYSALHALSACPESALRAEATGRR